MPELPEVETTLRGIAPHVQNQQIHHVEVRNGNLRWPVPEQLDKILTGQVIHHLSRRAKYLLLACDNGTLMIHLGMSGRLRILDDKGIVNKHDHIDIVFANGTILRYTDPRRFGAVLWTTEPVEKHALLNHLGPEPLDDDFDADYLASKANNRKTAIKTLIMNSEVVVGVGNIYANEALFFSGIYPERPAHSLNSEQIGKLVWAIKVVLEKAIAAGGTTLRDFRSSDGKPGYFSQELNVYAKKNMPCKQCGVPIKLIKQNQRATYYCPQCQPYG